MNGFYIELSINIVVENIVKYTRMLCHKHFMWNLTRQLWNLSPLITPYFKIAISPLHLTSAQNPSFQLQKQTLNPREPVLGLKNGFQNWDNFLTPLLAVPGTNSGVQITLRSLFRRVSERSFFGPVFKTILRSL